MATSALLTGCGSTEQKLQGSNITPAAQGTVVTKVDDNNNTNMEVTVKHLAPAQRVLTGATNYVVWVQPEGSAFFQNVGALQVDKNLDGSHKTTVPYKNFKVMVTPEMSTMTQTPVGPAVFEQAVMRQ